MIRQPLFSVILSGLEGEHLLPLTLDALKSQAEQDFETILIGGEDPTRLKELAQRYPELAIQVYSSKSPVVSEWMNGAMGCARGKYVQFLSAGDRFLSQEGLAYVRELIEEGKEPHFIYSGFLVRDPSEAPYAATVPLNRHVLQKGMFPTVAASSWFLREAVSELGGFDRRLAYRSAFDLLCRLFLKQGVRSVYSRRVLTDSEPHRTTPGAMIGYALETCRILYRHFGLWPAVRWIFVQDHLNMLKWSLRRLKEAFFRQEST